MKKIEIKSDKRGFGKNAVKRKTKSNDGKTKNAGYRMIKQKIKTQNDEGKNENKNSFYKEVKCVMRG